MPWPPAPRRRRMRVSWPPRRPGKSPPGPSGWSPSAASGASSYVSDLKPYVLVAYREHLLHDLGFKTATVDSEQASTLSELLKRGVARSARPRGSADAASRDGSLAGTRRAGVRAGGDGRHPARTPPPARRTATDARGPVRALDGCQERQARLLAWDGLDLVAGTARLVPQKGDPVKGRVIPLSDRCRRMLSHVERNGVPTVWGEIDERDPLIWLRQAAREAGVKGRVKFHHLRYSFTSWALNDPDPRRRLPVEDVAFILGHEDLRTTMKYRKPDLAAMRAGLNALR